MKFFRTLNFQSDGSPVLRASHEAGLKDHFVRNGWSGHVQIVEEETLSDGSLVTRFEVAEA